MFEIKKKKGEVNRGKRLTKILMIGMLIIMSLSIFIGCVDYGYEFHFDVIGENGMITINSDMAGIMQCKDEPAHELDCANTSKFIVLLGGKKGNQRLTFIAVPDEGYQVKERSFNGKIVENNKSNSYMAIVSSENNYCGIITVEFEAIPNN